MMNMQQSTTWNRMRHRITSKHCDDSNNGNTIPDIALSESLPARAPTSTPTTCHRRRQRRGREATRRPRDRSPVQLRSLLFVLCTFLLWIGFFHQNHRFNRCRLCCAEARDFEPYQLNGGLVTAVAGRNFCITASDTRMIGEGGYLLSSRTHIANRLWTVPTASSTTSHDNDDDVRDSEVDFLTLELGDDLEDFLRLQDLESGKAHEKSSTTCSKGQALVVPTSSTVSSSTSIVIGSSGCSTDCCQLKLDFISDYQAATSLGQMKGSCNTDNVATLLSQTLYSRRTFPYYAFCVVGGLEVSRQYNDETASLSSVATGKAYVYDAIGSYEQVAVATAGTGRELLQPVLDRMFARTSTTTKSRFPVSIDVHQQKVPAKAATASTTSQTIMVKRQAPLLQVDCTSAEAVQILCHAYRSVSEREIGVGDTLILHVSEAVDEGQGTTTNRIIIVPLKQH